MLGLKLSPIAQAVRGRRPWTPAALFAQGQQGVWYEPKPEYLFQDAAGTVPVTADGDPVGLMLDRSKGLELGPEALPLPLEFGGPDWTLAGTNASGSGSTFGSPSGNSAAVAIGLFTVGQWYELVMPYDKTASGELIIYNADNASVPPLVSETGVTGTLRAIFQAETTDINIRHVNAAMIDLSGSTVRELPGNHATQGTSADRLRYSSTPPNLVPDDVADQLNVTLPAIAAATVAIATPSGADIQYPVDLSSGSYVIDYQNSGVIILDREFTADETQQVTDYLNARAGGVI